LARELTTPPAGPVENYLSNFQWNKVKYRADKPIAELLSSLQSEVSSVDSDVKSKFAQYNNTKTNLATMQRSKTGNLSQKSLTSIVNPEWLLKPDASEYLQQHLIAVPAQQVKEFLQTYESLTAMVVPRSASLLAKDDEFHLYAVTVFKKHSSEFLHKCRESRWTPREWKFHEGGKEAEDEELQKLEKEERKVWGEALRLGRTGYSDAVMAWMHVLALRVFVETVLRYGLPLNFVAGIVKVCFRCGERHRSLKYPRWQHKKANINLLHRLTQSAARKQKQTSTPVSAS
jgi:V-type H+-transporting ATPase subunit C